MKTCTLENYTDICPLLDVHDKVEGSFYFLMMMSFSYHKADDFRFNLHAFIKSLREVTFMLQNAKDKIRNFDKWYEQKQNEMKENLLLKKLSDSRTIIVHKSMLKPKSKINVGLYRGRRLKLGIELPISNPFIDSQRLFNHYIPRFEKLGFIDEGHSALNEQLGIKRQWYCAQLGDEEILLTCYHAYQHICGIVCEAHSFFGYEFIPQGFPEGYIDGVTVILESDVNPSLPKKWGWI